MKDNYHVLYKEMRSKGWGSHPVLCLKFIDDPNFSREGKAFFSAKNLKQLDTFALFEQMGIAPDLSEEAGEPVRFKFLDLKGKGTVAEDLQAWIYRDRGLVGFVNKGKHLLCALSDVEHKLKV